MTTPHKQAAPSAFFQKERDRLIAEIADSVEQLLSNTNTLNRKLEESIAVGQEFEPISNLWGQFVDVMSSSGLSPQAAMEAAAAQAQGGEEEGREEGQAQSKGAAASSDDLEDTLPPGVAPGGGLVYGRGEGS